MSLTAVLQTRLSPAILDAFRARAKDLGFDSAAQMSRAWVIETVTQSPAPAGAHYDAIRLLTHQLHKVGVNLNQIAHTLNSGHCPSDQHVIDAVGECIAIVNAAGQEYRSLLEHARTPRLPK